MIYIIPIMIRKFTITILLSLYFNAALPCSTFFIDHNGQMVFGRNYDWVAGTGLVCTNHRGLRKTSFPASDGGTISWTSKYGSLSFNQYGKEFPTGGMNEKGLVVELMWLSETEYPPQDSRPSISVLQWIQYQLDNSANIDEVIATDKLLRITGVTTPLHYLVADAAGNAATIEFLGGKMVVHRGSQLNYPVLTNSPYAQSVQYAKQAVAGNGTVRGAGSLERFARACQLIGQYKSGNSKASLVDHSFSILESLSQGNYTKWSIVYDITNRQIHFRTNAAPQVKRVSFAAFDFSCSAVPLFLDMNQLLSGEANRSFKPLTAEINFETLRRSAELSKSEVTISASSQGAMAGYASGIDCK